MTLNFLIDKKLEIILPDFTISYWKISQVGQTAKVIWPELRLEEENIRALNVKSFGSFDARNLGRVPPEVQDPEVAVNGRRLYPFSVQNTSGQSRPDQEK